MAKLASDEILVDGGIFEVCIGVRGVGMEDAVSYWKKVFGYEKHSSGSLSERECEQLYGVCSTLHSKRLSHKNGTMIRLMNFGDAKATPFSSSNVMEKTNSIRAENLLSFRSRMLSLANPTHVSGVYENEFKEKSFTYVSPADQSFCIVVNVGGRKRTNSLSSLTGRGRSGSHSITKTGGDSTGTEVPLTSPVLNPARAFIQSPGLTSKQDSTEITEDFEKNFFL
jgi:hypothetical protein